jgi:lysophospholipase L1-like esterase
VNLVFIGDSLTEWYDWDRRFPEHRVLNLGISGETVEELLERRDRIRSVVRDPDRVFLMTGINNVLMERYEIAAPYREIVRNFTTWWKGATIVVQSLLPVEMPWINTDIVRDVNRHLSEIAREQRTDYLDLYSLFVDKNGKPIRGYLSDDGVHLAGQGYEVWAKAVEGYLRKD